MKPRSKPQAAREDVIDRLLESGLWTDRGLSAAVAVAVRGYHLSMGDAGRNDRGIYDDVIFLLSPDAFAVFNANTDPSIYRRGRAMLAAPQKITYRPGHHGYGRKSGHPAFRQASDVVVHRDGGTGHGRSLGGGRFTDKGGARFWTNLHRGGWKTTSSAGCLTVHPSQWDAFYQLMRHELRRAGRKTFNCYLIEHS